MSEIRATLWFDQDLVIEDTSSKGTWVCDLRVSCSLILDSSGLTAQESCILFSFFVIGERLLHYTNVICSQESRISDMILDRNLNGEIMPRLLPLCVFWIYCS